MTSASRHQLVRLVPQDEIAVRLEVLALVKVRGPRRPGREDRLYGKNSVSDDVRAVGAGGALLEGRGRTPNGDTDRKYGVLLRISGSRFSQLGQKAVSETRLQSTVLPRVYVPRVNVRQLTSRHHERLSGLRRRPMLCEDVRQRYPEQGLEASSRVGQHDEFGLLIQLPGSIRRLTCSPRPHTPV